MTPYFDDGTVTIYHGDCALITPQFDLGNMVLVTDPPYGVDLGTQTNSSGHGLVKGGYLGFADTYDHFISKIVPALNVFIDGCKRAAVFTGPHIHEQRKPDAIGGVFCPAAVGRHRWGFKSFLPVLFYGQAPNLHLGSKATAIRSTETASNKAHPVAKPIGWMSWLLDLCVIPGETVIDPFMGSGTTLRACKDLGIRAVGIEAEERYCEIAAQRMSQQTLFGSEAVA